MTAAQRRSWNLLQNASDEHNLTARVSRVALPCASFELRQIACRERRIAHDLPSQEAANLAQRFCIVAAERDGIFRLKRDDELVVVPVQGHTPPRLVQHGLESWIVRLAHQRNSKLISGKPQFRLQRIEYRGTSEP